METKKRVRSPNYPSIDLEEALYKAEQLYDKEKTHFTSVDVAAKHWGYKSEATGGSKVVAALRAYGFAETEGKRERRKIKLSDSGRRAVLGKRMKGKDFRKILQEAALRPSLHAELWDKWGAELPSDDAMSYYLVTDRRFNERFVADFIGKYRHTLEYSGLTEGVTATVEDEVGEEPSRQLPSAPEGPDASEGNGMGGIGEGDNRKPSNEVLLRIPYEGTTLTVRIDAGERALTASLLEYVKGYLDLVMRGLEGSGHREIS